jgi:hypothetical protein
MQNIRAAWIGMKLAVHLDNTLKYYHKCIKYIIYIYNTLTVTGSAGTGTAHSAAACRSKRGLGAGPRQEVSKERLVSVGGGRWTLMEMADEPVEHARLAGEGDALGRREDAVERPVLGVMIGVSTPGIYFGHSMPPTLPKTPKLNIYTKI